MGNVQVATNFSTWTQAKELSEADGPYYLCPQKLLPQCIKYSLHLKVQGHIIYRQGWKFHR